MKRFASLLMFLSVLAALILCAAEAFSQRNNTYYVDQFKGATIGAKTTAAQAACLADTTIPCVLIFDPMLAAWPLGTLPTKCAQCTWMDYSGKAGGLPATGSVGSCSGPLVSATCANFAGGMKCDNATDDAAAYAAAVAYMDANGGLLLFPNGRCLVSAGAWSKASYPWRGQGTGIDGTTFVWTGSKGTFTGTTNNLESIIFKNGDPAASTAIVNLDGITFDSLNNAHRASAAVATFRRTSARYSNLKFLNVADGLYLSGVTSTKISNIFVYGVGRWGIYGDSSSYVNASDFEGINCGVAYGACVWIGAGQGNDVHDSTIQGTVAMDRAYATGATVVVTQNGTSGTITLTDAATVDTYVNQNLRISGSTGASHGAASCDGSFPITAVSGATITYLNAAASDTCTFAAAGGVQTGTRAGVYRADSGGSYVGNYHEDSRQAAGTNYRPLLVGGPNLRIEGNKFSGCTAITCAYIVELQAGSGGASSGAVFLGNYPVVGGSGKSVLNGQTTGDAARFIGDTLTCDSNAGKCLTVTQFDLKNSTCGTGNHVVGWDSAGAQLCAADPSGGLTFLGSPINDTGRTAAIGGGAAVTVATTGAKAGWYLMCGGIHVTDTTGTGNLSLYYNFASDGETGIAKIVVTISSLAGSANVRNDGACRVQRIDANTLVTYNTAGTAGGTYHYNIAGFVSVIKLDP